MNQGCLHFVLHAHLPYVRHPELAYCLEENWLFEAITESYLPLLRVFDRLHAEAVPFRLTLSLSPTLLYMLSDECLQQRYRRYLKSVIEFAEQECARYRALEQQPALSLAEYQLQRLQGAEHAYVDTYAGDLIAVFARLQATGCLQLICCAATHGYLPLLNSQPQSVRRQIQIGLDCFKQHFGYYPRGFWLPECAYYPGVEQLLAEFGIEYFYLESQALTLANPPAEYAVYAPVDCGNGLLALARDPLSSAQVWSAQEGYPGHPAYLDFYQDAGSRVPSDDVPTGVLAEHTGCKYWRVTGGDGAKDWYDPRQAEQQVMLDAVHFVASKQQQCAELSEAMPCPPLIVAPFDAELFGHWWHEGPQWLEQVLRQAAIVGLPTVSVAEYRAQMPQLSVCRPVASSWGVNGNHEYWLSERNRWIYPLLDKAAGEFETLLKHLAAHTLNDLQRRAVVQALRELLLAQASDWAFLIESGSAVHYATQAVHDRLARFNFLLDSLRKNRIDERQLTALEILDAFCPELSFEQILLMEATDAQSATTRPR